MTNRIQIHFENPPVRQQRTVKKTRHEQITAKLRKRPGEWARIGTYGSGASMSSTAYHIRHAGIAAYTPAGAYEATGRTVDGKHAVWARYIGPDGEHA